MSKYVKRMPARFYNHAPESVVAGVADIIAIVPAAPLDYDIVFREKVDGQVVGLDFDRDGAQGCHSFLESHELRAYRDRNRRKRVAWSDLPEATRARVLAYLAA